MFRMNGIPTIARCEGVGMDEVHLESGSFELNFSIEDSLNLQKRDVQGGRSSLGGSIRISM